MELRFVNVRRQLVTAAAFAFTTAGLVTADSFTIRTLVTQGQTVTGVGQVTTIESVAVNDDGTWIVECDTTHSNTDADSVLIRNGALYLREGMALTPNGVLDEFDAVNVNANGNSGWNFIVSGAGDTTSGVYYDLVSVIRDGDFSTALEFGPESPYGLFFDVKMNNRNQLLVNAAVNDSVSTVGPVLVRFDLGPDGSRMSENVIAVQGQTLPGSPDPIVGFNTGPHMTAINDRGDVLFETGDALYLNHTLLARVGTFSPIPNRPYLEVGGCANALNNRGDYVHKADLWGNYLTGKVIIRNGVVMAQQRSPLPALAPYQIEEFPLAGPIAINQRGEVLYWADTTHPNDDQDEVLIFDNRVLVQQGVTQIEGKLVSQVFGSVRSFAMSPSGRYIIFAAKRKNAGVGAFLIEFCRPCDVNCDGSTNTFDISDFVSLLSNPDAVSCALCAADTDENGTVNQFDIQGFVDCLIR